MLNFDFFSPARILFGRDTERQIGALLKPHASKVLGELGIGEEQSELMAKKATGAAFGAESPIGGLKKFRWQDVLAIYRLAQ